MSFLDELQLGNLISGAVARQIRSAYEPFLKDLQRRECAGERLALADLIAYQFLLEKFLGTFAKCDAEAIPPLVRKLPSWRFNREESSGRLTETHGGDRDETRVASSELESSSDHTPLNTCAHCILDSECKHLGCAYTDLLESIAARLQALKASSFDITNAA